LTDPVRGNVTLKVEDVMTKEGITIDEHANVKEAADIMDKNEISCLIALRKGKAIGIITERDVLKRIIVEAKNPEKSQRGHVKPVRSRCSRHRLGKSSAVNVSEKNKNLPIIEKDNLLGLVSLTDIARFQPAIITLLKTFAAAHDIPRSMKKVIDY
jgi:predicted transcriptional regulator